LYKDLYFTGFVMKKYLLLSGAIALAILVSCDKMLQFSPFVTDLASDEQNLTSKNRDLLAKYKPAAKAGPDSIDFAFFTDVHFDYKALRKVVNRMNNMPDMQFAVCG